MTTTTAQRIKLPHAFTAREYQIPFLHAMETEGKRRAVCVWHRRAGKDKTFLNYMIPQMLQRVGSYYYYFPTASMGRDILWEGMDREGFKFTDHFPKHLVARMNQSEMKIELKNGSIFKIRGTDKREPIGVNPVGVVFSEYSRQNPSGGWDLVRPILAENDGWAVFNFTPRGKNHAYRLYRMAVDNPDWFCQSLPADTTGAITEEAIDDERRSGMSEELIQQEFYCSFDIGAEGSYYGRIISRLWADEQITNVPYNPEARVYTAWDIGIGDATAIWFFQLIRQEVRIIDHYENYGEGLDHYAKIVLSKPYTYQEHYFPHDAAKRQWQADGGTVTVHDIAKRMLESIDPETGRRTCPVKIIGIHSIEDGIEHTRALLQSKGKVWIDKTNCSHGIDCLENYHKEWDSKREAYHRLPVHDWSSHSADAFRYLATAYRVHIQVNGELVGYPKPISTQRKLRKGGSAYGRRHVHDFGRRV